MTRKARPNSKAVILAAAITIAKAKGLRGFSRVEIARAIEMAEATISFHFGTMDELREAIVQHAVDNEILPILAQVRLNRETFPGIRMSAELKQRIAAFIAA